MHEETERTHQHHHVAQRSTSDAPPPPRRCNNTHRTHAASYATTRDNFAAGVPHPSHGSRDKNPPVTRARSLDGHETKRSAPRTDPPPRGGGRGGYFVSSLLCVFAASIGIPRFAGLFLRIRGERWNPRTKRPMKHATSLSQFDGVSLVHFFSIFFFLFLGFLLFPFSFFLCLYTFSLYLFLSCVEKTREHRSIGCNFRLDDRVDFSFFFFSFFFETDRLN